MLCRKPARSAKSGTTFVRQRSTLLARAFLAMRPMICLGLAILATAVLCAAASEAPSVKLARLVGTVEVSHTKDTGGKWQAATKGQVIGNGWKLRTGKKSKVQIVLPLDNVIILKENSVLTVDKLSADGGGKVKQESGGALYDLKKALSAGSSFEVETPSALATVRGTSFGILLAGDGGSEDSGEDQARIKEESFQMEGISRPKSSSSGDATDVEAGQAEGGSYGKEGSRVQKTRSASESGDDTEIPTTDEDGDQGSDSAAKGKGGLATTKEPVEWITGEQPGEEAGKHKGQMGDVQSNPMYKENANQGSNPLFEDARKGATTPPFTVGNDPPAAACDLDGDGKADCAVGDLDGDGLPDLLVGGASAKEVKPGRFVAIGTVRDRLGNLDDTDGDGLPDGAINLGDLDGDGRDDFVCLGVSEGKESSPGAKRFGIGGETQPDSPQQFDKVSQSDGSEPTGIAIPITESFDSVDSYRYIAKRAGISEDDAGRKFEKALGYFEHALTEGEPLTLERLLEEGHFDEVRWSQDPYAEDGVWDKAPSAAEFYAGKPFILDGTRSQDDGAIERSGVATGAGAAAGAAARTEDGGAVDVETGRYGSGPDFDRNALVDEGNPDIGGIAIDEGGSSQPQGGKKLESIHKGGSSAKTPPPGGPLPVPYPNTAKFFGYEGQVDVENEGQMQELTGGMQIEQGPDGTLYPPNPCGPEAYEFLWDAMQDLGLSDFGMGRISGFDQQVLDLIQQAETLLKKEEGGRHTPFHNKLVDDGSGGGGGGSAGKQTQGSTFGEKVNQGLQSAGGALSQGVGRQTQGSSFGELVRKLAQEEMDYLDSEETFSLKALRDIMGPLYDVLTRAGAKGGHGGGGAGGLGGGASTSAYARGPRQSTSLDGSYDSGGGDALTKKGYDYWQAQSDMQSTGAQSRDYQKEPAKVEIPNLRLGDLDGDGFDELLEAAGDVDGDGVDDYRVKKGLNAPNLKGASSDGSAGSGGGAGGGGEGGDALTKKGYDYYQAQSARSSSNTESNIGAVLNGNVVIGDRNGDGLADMSLGDLDGDGLEDVAVCIGDLNNDGCPDYMLGLAIWASKKGYDYYQAQSRSSAGTNQNPAYDSRDAGGDNTPIIKGSALGGNREKGTAKEQLEEKPRNIVDGGGTQEEVLDPKGRSIPENSVERKSKTYQDMSDSDIADAAAMMLSIGDLDGDGRMDFLALSGGTAKVKWSRTNGVDRYRGGAGGGGGGAGGEAAKGKFARTDGNRYSDDAGEDAVAGQNVLAIQSGEAPANAIKTRPELKDEFQNGDIPNQEDFADRKGGAGGGAGGLSGGASVVGGMLPGGAVLSRMQDELNGLDIGDVDGDGAPDLIVLSSLYGHGTGGSFKAMHETAKNIIGNIRARTAGGSADQGNNENWDFGEKYVGGGGKAQGALGQKAKSWMVNNYEMQPLGDFDGDGLLDYFVDGEDCDDADPDSGPDSDVRAQFNPKEVGIDKSSAANPKGRSSGGGSQEGDAGDEPAGAKEPRTVLKEYFQTGDKPTQPQFAAMIDSCLAVGDLNGDGLLDFALLSSTGIFNGTQWEKVDDSEAPVDTDAARQSSAGQVKKVTVRGWDPEKKEAAGGLTGDPDFDLLPIGDLDGDGLDDYAFQEDFWDLIDSTVHQEDDGVDQPAAAAAVRGKVKVIRDNGNGRVLGVDQDGDGVFEPLGTLIEADLDGDGQFDPVLLSDTTGAFDPSKWQKKVTVRGWNPEKKEEASGGGQNQREYESKAPKDAQSGQSAGKMAGGGLTGDPDFDLLPIGDLDGDGLEDLLILSTVGEDIRGQAGDGSGPAGDAAAKHKSKDGTVTSADFNYKEKARRNQEHDNQDVANPSDAQRKNGEIKAADYDSPKSGRKMLSMLDYQVHIKGMLSADADGDGAADWRDDDCDGDGVEDRSVGDVDGDGVLDVVIAIGDVTGDGKVDFGWLSGQHPPNPDAHINGGPSCPVPAPVPVPYPDPENPGGGGGGGTNTGGGGGGTSIPISLGDEAGVDKGIKVKKRPGFGGRAAPGGGGTGQEDNPAGEGEGSVDAHGALSDDLYGGGEGAADGGGSEEGDSSGERRVHAIHMGERLVSDEELVELIADLLGDVDGDGMIDCVDQDDDADGIPDEADEDCVPPPPVPYPLPGTGGGGGGPLPSGIKLTTGDEPGTAHRQAPPSSGGESPEGEDQSGWNEHKSGGPLGNPGPVLTPGGGGGVPMPYPDPESGGGSSGGTGGSMGTSMGNEAGTVKGPIKKCPGCRLSPIGDLDGDGVDEQLYLSSLQPLGGKLLVHGDPHVDERSIGDNPAGEPANDNNDVNRDLVSGGGDNPAGEPANDNNDVNKSVGDDDSNQPDEPGETALQTNPAFQENKAHGNMPDRDSQLFNVAPGGPGSDGNDPGNQGGATEHQTNPAFQENKAEGKMVGDDKELFSSSPGGPGGNFGDTPGLNGDGMLAIGDLDGDGLEDMVMFSRPAYMNFKAEFVDGRYVLRSGVPLRFEGATGDYLQDLRVLVLPHVLEACGVPVGDLDGDGRLDMLLSGALAGGGGQCGLSDSDDDGLPDCLDDDDDGDGLADYRDDDDDGDGVPTADEDDVAMGFVRIRDADSSPDDGAAKGGSSLGGIVETLGRKILDYGEAGDNVETRGHRDVGGYRAGLTEDADRHLRDKVEAVLRDADGDGWPEFLSGADLDPETRGVIQGGFKELTGLESEVEIIEYKDGDDPITHKRAGKGVSAAKPRDLSEFAGSIAEHVAHWEALLALLPLEGEPESPALDNMRERINELESKLKALGLLNARGKEESPYGTILAGLSQIAHLRSLQEELESLITGDPDFDLAALGGDPDDDDCDGHSDDCAGWLARAKDKGNRASTIGDALSRATEELAKAGAALKVQIEQRLTLTRSALSELDGSVGNELPAVQHNQTDLEFLLQRAREYFDEWERYVRRNDQAQMLLLYIEFCKLEEAAIKVEIGAAGYKSALDVIIGSQFEELFSDILPTLEPDGLPAHGGNHADGWNLLQAMEEAAGGFLPEVGDEVLVCTELGGLTGQQAADWDELIEILARVMEDAEPLVEDHGDIILKSHGILPPGAPPALGIRNLSLDTDNDGIPDGVEILLGMDPSGGPEGGIELVNPDDGEEVDVFQNNETDFEFLALDTDAVERYDLVLEGGGQRWVRKDVDEAETVNLLPLLSKGGPFAGVLQDGAGELEWHVEALLDPHIVSPLVNPAFDGVIRSLDRRLPVLFGEPQTGVIIDLTAAGQTTLQPGQQLRVRGSISEISALGQWQIRIAYDDSLLQFTQGARLGIFSGSTVFFSVGGGLLTVSGTAPVGTSVSGEGDIFELTFTALEAGDTSIEGDSVELLDQLGNEIEADFGESVDAVINAGGAASLGKR